MDSLSSAVEQEISQETRRKVRQTARQTSQQTAPQITTPRISAQSASFTAADLIISTLHDIGVEYVFGVPGGAIEPLYDALARSARRGGPKAVVARHEAGAAFMADGYARETGKIGVCIATSGPGATNLMTGVACAYETHVPLLVLTGQPVLPSFGKRALQESGCIGVNTLGMFRHCTRYNSFVSHIDQVENKLLNALMRAQQTPAGPAHLSIPVDILRGIPTQNAETSYDMDMLFRKKPSLVDEYAVQSLLAELGDARRLVFLIGNGCAEAIEALMKLVDLTQAVFVTTPDGKGLINPRHPAYRGVFGFGGHASADALLRSLPDLILAFGTGFGEFASGGWSTNLLNNKLIHIDSYEENLMRSPMARLHVRGRIRSVCERLVKLLEGDSRNAYHLLEVGRAKQERLEGMFQSPEGFHSDATPIKPQRLMKELSERFPPNTRFVADAGNSMVWSVHYLQPLNRRALRTPKQVVPNARADRRSGTANWLRVTMDFAPMGWAIGCAVGLAHGNPQDPVVCITGDGAYLMSGQEITVAAQQELPVIFVILNDSAYGMVMHGQRLAGAEQIGFELPQVDFSKMAAAMGIPSHVINGPEDFDQLDFATILRRKGPTLLDVRIDREEVPPMKVRMKTLGTVK